MHRRVFRQHERGELVEVANVLAQAGLAVLGLAVAVGVMTLMALTGLWFIAPHFFPRVSRPMRGRPKT